jgi:prepilin-type processing-associated H-X9-DG protein
LQSKSYQKEDQVHQKKFTMIELFILIVVIIIIGGMVVPIFTKKRMRCIHITCSGNLKQVGVGMLMYASDFDGFFPMTPEGNSLEPLNKSGYIKNGGRIADTKHFCYTCPSTSSGRTTADNADYWYAGAGLKDDNVSASEVSIVYDLYGNHAIKGKQDWANSLYLDGHAEGHRSFANEHAVVKP